jgi:hypothetical protein
VLSRVRYFTNFGACLVLLLSCFPRASADDGQGLSIDGFVHVQWLADFTRYAAPRHGFNLKRGRLEFRYDLAGAAAEVTLGCDELELSVKDALVEYRVARQLGFAAGLAKMPFSREELTPVRRLLTAERSRANDEFGDVGYLGRDIGLTASGDLALGGAALGYAAGVYNGNGDRLALDNNDAKQFCERLTFAPSALFEAGVSGSQRNDSASGALMTAWGADAALKLAKGLVQLEAMAGNSEPGAWMAGLQALAGYRLGAFEPVLRLEWLAEELGDPADRTVVGTLGCNWYPVSRVQLKANLMAALEPGPDSGPQVLLQAQVGF